MRETKREKVERNQWLQRRRENHHKALETLAQQVGCNTPGLKLWRQLRRLENSTYPQSLALCNGDIDQAKWEAVKDEVRAKITKIFGSIPKGFYVNGDARGHALKLDCDDAPIPEGMERDWGGNGILAAEID